MYNTHMYGFPSCFSEWNARPFPFFSSSLSPQKYKATTKNFHLILLCTYFDWILNTHGVHTYTHSWQNKINFLHTYIHIYFNTFYVCTPVMMMTTLVLAFTDDKDMLMLLLLYVRYDKNTKEKAEKGAIILI